MAIPSTGAGVPPKAVTTENEPKRNDVPKKNTASDNTAAATAPRETRTAVQNMFGPVSQGKTAPEDSAKKADPKTAITVEIPTPASGGAKQPGTAAPKQNFYGNTDPKHSPGDYAKTPDGANYAKTPDGNYIRYNQDNNAVAVDAKNNVVADRNGNPYALNDQGAYARTADGEQNYIVYDQLHGNKAIAIDKDDKPIVGSNAQDPKVVSAGGTYAKTVDGSGMVYVNDSGGKIAATRPVLTENGVVQKRQMGPDDNTYLVNADGMYAITPDGKYMAFGPGPEGKYVAISDNKVFSDTQGRPYTLTAEGNYMQPEPGTFGVLDKQSGNVFAVDAKGNTVADKDGNPYMVGDDGKYAKKPDGRYEIYYANPTMDPDRDKVPDPATAKVPEGAVKTPDGTGYAKTADGKFYIKLDEFNNKVAVDGFNNVARNSKGDAYALNDQGEFAKTADAEQNPIVHDKTLGGKLVATDFDNDPIRGSDREGNPKVVNLDGTYAKTADGREMVYPKDSGGKIGVVGSTGLSGEKKLVTGPGDNVYLVKPDGQYAIASDGKYMAFSRGPDGKYVAISDGKLFADSQGRPFTLTADGNYMQPEPGRFVVYDKQSDKLLAVESNGMPVVDAGGNPRVVGDDGKYIDGATV